MSALFESDRRGIMLLKRKAIIIGTALFLIAIILAIGPIISGFIILSESTYTFDFSNFSQYTYNSSEINLSDNQAKLSLQIETTTTTTTNYLDTSLSAATYDGEDVLSMISAIDDEKQQVKSDKAFEITFSNQLNNSDVLGIYMANSSEAATIYACKQNESCASPGYGSVSYNASEGWFNITLNGLNETASSFRIRTTDKIKFDYIKATYAQNITENITINFYPNSSIIETLDLYIDNLSKWETFTANENPNGQIVNYAYSIDSGNNWSSVISGSDLSSADANSKKIRFKATLNSDGNITPIVNSININYETFYICTENWTCSGWSSCYENSTQARTCTDSNACNTTTNKPNETQNCNYIPSIIIINQTNNTVSVEANKSILFNASAFGDTELEIFARENVINTSLAISKYENISVLIANISEKPLGKYPEINTSTDLSDKINWAIIKVYYTQQELQNKNLNESTLKLYFYNETTENWTLIQSFVNTSGKYMWANVTHLSLYGIFGDENIKQPQSPAQESPPSGEATKSGSESLFIKPSEKKTEPKKTEKPAPTASPAPAPVAPAEPIQTTQPITTQKIPAAIPSPAMTPSVLAILIARVNATFVIGAIAAQIALLIMIKYGKIKKKEQKAKAKPAQF